MSERKFPTPYFVIDEEQLTRDFTMLTDSLDSSWPNYRVGYSFKTNSVPWLVTFLKEICNISEGTQNRAF